MLEGPHPTNGMGKEDCLDMFTLCMAVGGFGDISGVVNNYLLASPRNASVLINHNSFSQYGLAHLK